MRRYLILLLILLLHWQYNSLHALSADSTIRVGVYNNEPLLFADANGQGKGIFADIIEHVAAKEGWQIEYVTGSWQQCLSRLENNKIDLLGTIAFSRERDKLYDFNKESLLTNWGQLFVPKGSDIKQITDVAGKKVAVLKGDIHQKRFAQLIKKFGIKCEFVETNNYESVLALVARNRADAGVVNRFFGMRYGSKYNVDQSGVVFNPIRLYFAVPEGKNTNLIETMDRHIVSLKRNEDSEYYRSLNKWLEALPGRQTFPWWGKWVIAIVLGIAVFLFFGNIVLGRRVRAKTQDLTDELKRRRQAEEALLESEEKYRSLVESTQDSIYVVNRDCTYLFMNKRHLSRLGVPKDNATGKTYREFHSASDTQEFIKEVEKVFASDAPLQHEHKSHRDGKHFLRALSPIIGPGGRTEAVTVVSTDITDRVQAEKERLRLQDKLHRSQKMEAMGLMAGGVAHDLNNILSGIVSYPELLLMDLPEDSPLKRPIEIIQESGMRAADVVEDLLTIARGVATGKETLNLNTIVTEYLESPEYEKLDKTHSFVDFETELDLDLLNISGSSTHIKKTLMNLVVNASEAIEGTGTVTISTMNCYLDEPLKGYTGIRTDEYAVLSVSDDGSGITPDDLERIFEPFYTKKVMGRSGTGLGLAVVWNTVQDHNGYINVNTSEKGTVFELYFPVTRDEVTVEKEEVPLEDYLGHGEKILVVDDEERQREIASGMLTKLGYNPEAVSSGEEAIEYMKEKAVDLILLDMVMPKGINGRKTYEEIIKIRPGQKAIIASGYAKTKEVDIAQRLGAGKYVKKPYILEKIGIAVKEELEK